jgi:solute carrier family 25 carnitine/acylcarnitine transporter 20/29
MDYVFGCIGGFVGTVISHPIDTVKTRVQSNFNLIDAIKMKNFFSGIKFPIILVPVEKAIVFGVGTECKNNNIGSMASGFIAGFASTLIVTPMEYLKINIQNGLQLNLRTLKLSHAYNGIIPTICRESPGYAVYFGTYDTLTKCYNREMSMAKNFLFGGITGLVSWLVIYPTDLVKTKIQDKNNTKTLTEIIKNIWNDPVSNKHVNLRIMNFYNGLSWALIRAVPLHAGVFTGYELSKKYLL